jgi:hypothetical protein
MWPSPDRQVQMAGSSPIDLIGHVADHGRANSACTMARIAYLTIPALCRKRRW